MSTKSSVSTLGAIRRISSGPLRGDRASPSPPSRCAGIAWLVRQEEQQAAARRKLKGNLRAATVRREGIRRHGSGEEIPLLHALGRRLDNALRGRVDAGVDQQQQFAVGQLPALVEEDALVARRALDHAAGPGPATGTSNASWRGPHRLACQPGLLASFAPRSDGRPSTSAGGGPQETIGRRRPRIPPAASSSHRGASRSAAAARPCGTRLCPTARHAGSEDDSPLRTPPCRAITSSQPMSYSDLRLLEPHQQIEERLADLAEPARPASESSWYIQAVVVGSITRTWLRCWPIDIAADSRVMYWAITWYESHHGSW